jgi:hypothetical protein
MRIFQVARHPTRAVRTALLALLLALGLNAFAHAGHSHESVGSATAALHTGCGYCATFTGLADAPRAVSFAPLAPYNEPPSTAARPAASLRRILTAVSARGPPHA